MEVHYHGHLETTALDLEGPLGKFRIRRTGQAARDYRVRGSRVFGGRAERGKSGGAEGSQMPQ